MIQFGIVRWMRIEMKLRLKWCQLSSSVVVCECRFYWATDKARNWTVEWESESIVDSRQASDQRWFCRIPGRHSLNLLGMSIGNLAECVMSKIMAMVNRAPVSLSPLAYHWPTVCHICQRNSPTAFYVDPNVLLESSLWSHTERKWVSGMLLELDFSYRDTFNDSH